MASSSRSAAPTCERCHQPLLLDPTITSLTPSQHTLITSALPVPSSPSSLSPNSKLNALPPSSNPSGEIWAKAHGLSAPTAGGSKQSVAESFILLSESTVLPPNQKSNDQTNSGQSSYRISQSPTNEEQPSSHTLATNLHQILSSRTPISHPLCTECTNHLQVELQRQLEDLSKERDAYIAFERGILTNRENLKTAKSEDYDGNGKNSVKLDGDDGHGAEGFGEFDLEGTDTEWQELMKRREELQKEEEELKRVLAAREAELARVRKEEEDVKKEEMEVEKEETEFLKNHLTLTSNLSHLKASLQTSQTHLLLSQSLLQSLESTNVYNDAFQIGQTPLLPSDSSAAPYGASPGSASGSGGKAATASTVGTINGLRLGGRPIVDWEEINAAWGLVALCVDRIGVKVGCVFDGYKIIPLGSFSRIEELPPKKGVYELYASSDIAFGRVFQNRRFDNGLVALLECLRQLVEFGRRDERGWGGGGIEINKDKISGYSIKLPGITNNMTLPSMSVMGFGVAASGSGSGGGTSGNGSISPQSTSSHHGDKSSGVGGNASPDEVWTKACAAVLRVLKRILLVESENERALTASVGL